jgi:hypothetical protein
LVCPLADIFKLVKIEVNMKKYLAIFLIAFYAISNNIQAQSEEKPSGFIQLNSPLSYSMMEANQDLKKLDLFQEAQRDQVLTPGNLTIGAAVIGIMDYQHSNTEAKFGYLMRHPTANNQRTQDVSEAVIHSVQLSMYGAINNWVSLYAEMLYNPEQSFGQGTITSLGRNVVQLRKGFILLGDLEKFPLSLAFGKMDGNFGQTGSVSPFTNSTMWHAFGTLVYGANLGFNKYGLNASVMLIQGGAQFRAANTPVDNTNVPSKLNNFSLDANYTLSLPGESNLKVGASYLNGSAYCQPWPVQHFMPCEETNPAYVFYGKLDYYNLTLMGSFATTVDPWPGTFNPNPPLDVFEAAKVTSLSYGAKYLFNSSGSIQYVVSGEFSNFVAGPDGSPWHRQNQIVLGLAAEMNHSSKLFFEVFRTNGYAPLNFISGGNMDDLGETHSQADANSLGIVFGGMITL